MPNGGIDPEYDYVATLSKDKQKQWPAIVAARSDAIEVQELLTEKLRPYGSGDFDIVVFGSLARREWTSGSDVDWTMLIDGQASADHLVNSRQVQETLRSLTHKGAHFIDPGAEGIFGNMAFSHEIVHHIGGQADTNRNTTQRVLLLLEAVSLRSPGGDLGPCERVIRQVLYRYLASDSNFHTKTDQESRIPRFLLNDIVRYWRTMCVDFAYKDWEQSGKKWALRNIKLRTSRKLMFVSGLLTVFSCFQNDDLRRTTNVSEDYLLKMQEHLLKFVHATPLNIIVWAFQAAGLDDCCAELLDEYEQFLSSITLNRSHLAGLKEKGVYDDPTFLKCREISHRLQAVLNKAFVMEDTPLREFIFEYGVF